MHNMQNMHNNRNMQNMQNQQNMHNTTPSVPANEYTTVEDSAVNKVQHTQPVKPVAPLVSIKARKIILPGEKLNIKTDLPDQIVLIEAIKTHRWPPPTLAAIKNNVATITNTTKSPVLLDGKSTLSLCLTPTSNSSISNPTKTVY